MKNLWMIGALVSGVAMAQMPQDLAKKVGKPCQAIKAACEAAGFVKGGHKDAKGLWKDCIGPLMDGKSVAGVSVGADQVEACKKRRAEHKKLKQDG